MSVAVLLFGFGPAAAAQELQFGFDADGNLLTQSSESAAAPQILAQPQLQVVVPGELASFFVLVADTTGLTFQWLFNGTNLSGATTDTLLLTNVGTGNQGQYSVVLVNGSGSVTSAPAALMLDSRGCGMPDSWQLTYFGNLNQTATGDFDGDGVSNLQEFLDGTNPANPSSALYRLTVQTDGGLISVVPNLPAYTNGQTVTLTASPSNTFRAWTGDLFARSNTVTLAMTTNRTMFAHFTTMGFVWTNAAGGDWNAAANWSPNLVPGSNDNAFITLSVTVNVTNDTDCGGLNLGDDNSSPTLTGGGTLTLHGSSVWSFGNMSGSGRTLIAPGATMALANVSSLALTTRTLENAGSITWAYLGAGGLTLYSGAVITNRPGALFEVQVPATLSYGTGAAARFDNAGTFLKSLDNGTCVLGSLVNFNNYGTVTVDSGTLQLSGNFTNTGTVDISAGTFQCSGPSLLINGAVTLSPGTTCIMAGTGSGSGTLTAPPTALVDFSAGTFILSPGAQLDGEGLYEVSGSAHLNANTAVSVQNLDLSATLAGSGVLTVSNVLSWTGGAMNGTGRTLIAPGATLDVGTSGVTLNSTLENGGTTLCTGSGAISGNGGVITNDAGALFEVQNDSAFTQSGSACRFDNAGTFRRSVSTGTNSFSAAFAFNNYANVDLQTGTLLFSGAFLNNGVVTLSPGATNRMGGGGSAAGVFSAAANSLVEWPVNNYTLNAGAQLNGPGLYQINGGGTLTVNTGLAIPNLNLVGSANPTLSGNGTVTISSVLNWVAGTMTGNGRTVIAPGATLNLANPSAVDLFRPLENGGAVLWTGPGDFVAAFGTVITNRPGALFEVQNNARFSYQGGIACRFDNAGTFRKDTGTGTNTFSSSFGLNNYNTLNIRSGIVVANGGYTCTANSTLNCALGGTTPGTGYGQLQVAGTVTLNGALSLVLANNYLPATNDSFTVLAAGTRNGTFANFYYPSDAVTMQLSNTATSVIVGVTGVVPPRPVLLPPSVSGTNVLLTWTAVSNITYRLEFNPNLNPSNWSAVPGDVTSLSNLASKLDPLTPSNRFYRVRVLP